MPDPRIAYLPDLDASERRFPNAVRIGDVVYLSSQPIVPVPPAASPRIQDQTHKAFSDFVRLLESVGVRMADLVKLHTFYVYDGDPTRATEYWEQMTEVRLQYFANPGPAGTALRVKTAPTAERLIAIDGIARADAQRQRIMPAHAWDWSMPTPLSQGWRVGNIVYAGGQISADRQGKTVAANDLRQQVVNTMEFLRHVLVDAGAGFEDIVSLKIGYQDRGDATAARRVLDEILRVVQPLLQPGQCTLTCLGIDLLYEGLQLEIDAMAIVGAGRSRKVSGTGQAWCGAPGFATATRADGLVHIGGIGAPEQATLADQLRVALQRLDSTMVDIGARADQLVKLNVLFAGPEGEEAADYGAIYRMLAAALPQPGPVVTIVRVAGLPNAGQRVQLDGVAMA
jgi:enamine deaminase RidA (YjgF/YER057c/UK114 family)